MAKNKFSNKKNYLEIYGVDEIVKKCEKASANLEEVMKVALEASAELPRDEMKHFMSKAGHFRTGRTYSSFVDEGVKTKGSLLEYRLGFDINNGGLPALFLDIGTPRIKPTFFVYYAFNGHVDEIKRIQQQAIENFFRDF